MLNHNNPAPAPPARVVVLGAGGFIAPELRRVLEQAAIPVKLVGSRELDLSADGSASQLAGLINRDDAVAMAAALTPDKGRDIGTLMKNLCMAENVCASLA